MLQTFHHFDLILDVKPVCGPVDLDELRRQVAPRLPLTTLLYLAEFTPEETVKEFRYNGVYGMLCILSRVVYFDKLNL